MLAGGRCQVQAQGVNWLKISGGGHSVCEEVCAPGGRNSEQNQKTYLVKQALLGYGG